MCSKSFPMPGCKGFLMSFKPSYEELEQRIKELEEKYLQESEVKYRTIFENIQDIYFETSVDGVLLEVSPSVERLFGYQREGFIGTSLHDIYANPSDRYVVIEELLKHGKLNDHEIFLKDANGFTKYCLVTAALVRGEHNEPVKIVGSLRNITDRKRAENALRESEAQKLAILEASIDRIRYVDKDMRVIWANTAAASGLNISVEDLKGRRCYEVLIGRDTPCEGCPTAKAMETGEVQRTVMYQPKMNGIEGESYWDAYCVPIKDSAGEILSYLQVSRNVTEEKRTALALLEKENTLRAILDASPVGIGLARDRAAVWANRAMYDLLGYEEKEIFSNGRTTRLFYPDDEEFDRLGQELFSTLKDTGIVRMDTKWARKDGKVLDCYVQATLLDPSDPGKGIIVTALDITDRKEVDDRIHWLTHEMIRVQENERQRISRELHDRVAQELSMSKIITDQLLQSQKEAEPPEVGQEIAKISGALQAAIHTVRNLAYDLRPPMLDDMGLVHAVLHYCDEFSERTGLTIEFSSAGLENVAPDPDTAINLYRLIQEGLNNIHKHAEAARARVKLVGAFPNIILRIEDDGKGFDVDARRSVSTHEKRMGLQSMEERVHLLSGKLDIQSRPMKGTKIIVRIPVKETKRDA
jgi:PAS domain S-box-containing protein